MELLSGKSDTSSKRFSALFTLGNLILLTYLAAWKHGWVTPEFMYTTLAMIVGGGLGLTVIEKIFNKNRTPAPSITPPVVDTPVVDTPTTDNPDQA